jgi:hypothetical protein
MLEEGSFQRNLQEETRIFNTFVSNDSQVLHSIRNNSPVELIQLPPLVSEKAEPKKSVLSPKKKITKAYIKSFIENQEEPETDLEMLQDEEEIDSLLKEQTLQRQTLTWQELLSFWNLS